jgi:hypothetical protein
MENFRANGAGAWGSLATDPHDGVVGVSNRGIQVFSSSGQMGSFAATAHLANALSRALGRLPTPASSGIDINNFVGGTGIAVGANGTVYVDTDAGVWSDRSGILAVSPDGHVSKVWRSPSATPSRIARSCPRPQSKDKAVDRRTNMVAVPSVIVCPT